MWVHMDVIVNILFRVLLIQIHLLSVFNSSSFTRKGKWQKGKWKLFPFFTDGPQNKCKGHTSVIFGYFSSLVCKLVYCNRILLDLSLLLFITAFILKSSFSLSGSLSPLMFIEINLCWLIHCTVFYLVFCSLGRIQCSVSMEGCMFGNTGICECAGT